MAFYGHIIIQDYTGSPETIIDEQRFAYPVYVVFLLAPIAYVAFAHVQAWSAVLAILSVCTMLLWLDFLRWRLCRTTTAAVALFVVGSPQIIQGLRLRQLGLVAGFMLALGAWCVVKNRLAVAGFRPALSRSNHRWRFCRSRGVCFGPRGMASALEVASRFRGHNSCACRSW